MRNRQVEITPMRIWDLDQVMDIERSSFRAPWSYQVFAEELDRDWAYLDVVRLRRTGVGTVVAFCNYWLVRDEVHILNVACHPEHRRRGFAAQLMGHMVDFAKRHRCRYLTLEVRRSNKAAIKLYRGFDFRPVGIRPHYYVEDNEDAIVMLLEL
jgi:ribosomal-protein-alanine N-acetyltransferase